MTKLDELREDSLLSEWLDNLNAATNTEEAYLQGVQAYLNFTGMTPEQLITEAEDEITDGVLMRRRKIKKYLIDFRKHLQDKGLADFSIRSRMTGVRSFYNSFEIELPKLQGDKRRARTLEGNKDIPTKEDLQDILRVCDPLERAMVLVGASSGLASNEIRHLKIKQFKNGYDTETGITTLEITRGKTGVEFITYLTPEASRAVTEYLDFRGRDVKAATCRRKQQLEKQRIVSDDGYLFILRQVPDEFLESQDDELRKLTENAIQKLYRAISDKANKNTKADCYNVIRSHTMRKYFNSVMLNKGCDSFRVEFFMGHQLDNTRAAYFRASPKELKEIYKQYIPYLTIVGEAVSIADSPEWRDLKDENARLKALAEKYYIDGIELINAKFELQKMKLQALPEEERKQEMNKEITNFVKDMDPKNDSQKRFQEEMKKILKL